MFIETINLAANYSDCHTIDAFCRKKYGHILNEEIINRTSFYEANVKNDAEELFIV